MNKYANRSDGLTMATNYPGKDLEHRTQMRSYADGRQEIDYSGRKDGLKSETNFPGKDSEHRTQTGEQSLQSPG